MTSPLTTRLLHLYRIGPGPSSSHTLGPLRAANFVREEALRRGIRPARFRVELFGSLSATGKGHHTDRAVLAGLQGWDAATCDVDALNRLPETLAKDPTIDWGETTAELRPQDVVFVRFRGAHEALPHPNTLVFRLEDTDGRTVFEETWCSVGGGFVGTADGTRGDLDTAEPTPPRYPFHNGATLLEQAAEAGVGFGDLVLANERAWGSSPTAIDEGLDEAWAAMRACIRRGLERRGDLPGGLGVRRRAAAIYERVRDGRIDTGYAPIARAQAYAFAVNEENAAGGRVVTAPTNGAAGILPAVLAEVQDRLALDATRIRRALATAGAIAMIIKAHASLSGAEVGCQGEVGSATAMAAAALCEVLGGTPSQVEYAAEIGMEHNLGLTCDPMKGLVQAPCIERNAMGVAKVWSAAQLALHAEGAQVISLDRVIRVMKRTGLDMRHEYKETGTGGLAVNLPEC